MTEGAFASTDDGVRLARAALTRLMEPGDLAGAALVAVAGPQEAVALIRSGAHSSAVLEQGISALLSAAGASRWPGLAPALSRWRPRVPDLAPARDLHVISRLGGGLLIPEDAGWPAALAELELGEPLALWTRGAVAQLPPQRHCIALVGSRDSTGYGDSLAAEIAAALVQAGGCVVSGGAYGIDAQAHRGALTVDAAPGVAVPPTIAVMAGGLDRLYPAGNEELLRAVMGRGVLLAEVPPGSNPTRFRFLQRNRLIAALCEVTVVVEARWRSGALNTAHHAAVLGRAVGAVPGSVYSANSAGCHRLLREGAAVCVCDAADIAELAGRLGTQLPPEPQAPHAVQDGLGVEELLLLDALPLHSASTADKLGVVAGLGTAAVLTGLGRLELGGLARRHGTGWMRAEP